MEDKINDPWGWITTHQYSSNNLEVDGENKMDKEAQGAVSETKAIYTISADLLHLDFLQPQQGLAWKIAKLIYQKGYRKLPQEKPPLLSDEEIVGLIANREMSGDLLTTGERWGIIKVAERDICIKHYEG